MFNPTFLLLLALATSASPVKRANNQLIVSSRDQKCLSPAGGAAAVVAKQVGNGTPLVTMDCSQAAGWDISPGSGSVILTGTNYAMDAGTTPGNNGLLKVSDRVSRVVRHTDDADLAVVPRSLCADLVPHCRWPNCYYRRQPVSGRGYQWYVSPSLLFTPALVIHLLDALVSRLIPKPGVAELIPVSSTKTKY